MNHTTTTPDAGFHADETTGGNAFARYLPSIARFLMGLMFFVFGLNGFLHFIPQPKTAMPEGAVAFVGALLLANRFVPLALALIAPVIVNIIAFHAFLAPSGAGMGAVVLVLEIYLAWAYRKAFLPMLAPRVKPSH